MQQATSGSSMVNQHTTGDLWLKYGQPTYTIQQTTPDSTGDVWLKYDQPTYNMLVHIGTNNIDKEGTIAIVKKCKNLLKKTKEARVGQSILSWILPVFGTRSQGYRDSRRMAVNGMVKQLCREEEVGCVDLWETYVGKKKCTCEMV